LSVTPRSWSQSPPVLGIVHASGPIAVYALVDKVAFEPNAGNAGNPDRIQISGVFITAGGGPNAYSAPHRGYLYFMLPAGNRELAFAGVGRSEIDSRYAPGGGIRVGLVRPVTRMLAWVDALPAGQRFFLTYLPIAGHHPYATPEPGPFPGSDEIVQYRNALHYGDVSLGALVDGLRARGLEQDTVWVIYGDHGEAFGQHEGNYAHTFFLYEENIHVPFLIVAPGLIQSQKRVREVVSLVDTAPTLLDLLGIPRPADYRGRTMLDGARRMALFFTDYSLGILGLRDGPWKFIYEIQSGRVKLFDIERDPQEFSDLSAREETRVSWYRKAVREWCSAALAGQAPRLTAAGPN
jgi:Sulfatase